MSNALHSIYVDSDAFVALVKTDDSNHGRAKKIFQEVEHKPVVFYTSNLVFAECVTVMSQRISKGIALQFIESFTSKESIFTTIRVTEQIEESAIGIFRRQTSKNVSFVDCTNMAIMEMEHLDSIFSFDNIYRKNGFSILK